MADRGWGRPFEDPIEVDGRTLATPRDVGEYITGLPKREHDAPEWRAAAEALLLVAEGGGPTMFARIGITRALNRHRVPEFNPKGKEPHWDRVGSNMPCSPTPSAPGAQQSSQKSARFTI